MGRLLAALLLAVAARAASHASYAKLYKEFDKGGLSDGYTCTDAPASFSGTILSASKQTSAEACRAHCRRAPWHC